MPKRDTKIIYIEIDEELTSLIDRIKKSSERQIVIVIPKRAVLLQSVVNLKLLKSQTEKLNKELSLVTTDKTGRNLASQVGITVYQSLERPDRENDGDEMYDGERQVKEAKAEEFSSDRANSYAKKHFDLRRESLSPREKFWMRTEEEQKLNEKVKQQNDEEFRSYTVVTPNKKILIGLFSFSVLLLLIIGYYVLPNATVKVQPKIEKISYSTNITLADYERYKGLLTEGQELKTIGSFPIEISEISLTKDFQTTGERFIGQAASGKLKVINTARTPWTFVQGTRFQTDSGVVFRAMDRVIIPGSQTAEVEVLADEKDVNGAFSGDRGNLKQGTRLFLPGLREESRKLVYAEALLDISNGVSRTEKILTKDDLLAAKANIVDELYKVAENKLKEKIAEENTKNKQNLRLFLSRDFDAVKKEVISVQAPEDLEGKALTNFQVSAKIKVSGMAYDQAEILKILNEGLQIKVLEDRVLTTVKGDEVEFNVVSNNDAEKKMKVESMIQGITEYKVDGSLGDKIRGKILGKSLEEAANIIKEMPEIGEVRIETWPFWVKKIPAVRSNILIERL